jgi:hypothetical protein
MKDLIAISAYCPDIDRKKCLIQTLIKIQELRENFDILLVTHSPIDTTISELVDFAYYDSNNEILSDFDLTNKFDFISDGIFIKSSLVYPKSTHLAVYRLIYYIFNFAKFHNYNKVHYVEYDFDLENINIVEKVNLELDEVDNIMFRDLDDTNFVIGSYFAFTTKNLDSDFNRDQIIQEYKNHECVTEVVTPMILTKNNRTIKFLNTKILNQDIYKISKIDSHDNKTLKWSVPLYNFQTGHLDFFIYNEFGGNYVINLYVNNQPFTFDNINSGCWYIQDIGEFESISNLKVYVNDNLRLDIEFESHNRQTFKENNYVRNC